MRHVQKRRFSANRKRADGKVRAFACDSTPGDDESGTERLRPCTARHRNRCCLRESRRADGRCHQLHGRNEKASYRNADNILQDGTDQSRGNGSKKAADSIDGAMLLPETCEECCGKTHGLYHYVSEKNLRTANRAGAIHGIAVSVSAGGTWNLY